MKWRGTTEREGMDTALSPVFHGVALPVSEQIVAADKLPKPVVCDHFHKYQDTALKCGQAMAKQITEALADG